MKKCKLRVLIKLSQQCYQIHLLVINIVNKDK